jgi:hypothetical protein
MTHVDLSENRLSPSLMIIIVPIILGRSAVYNPFSDKRMLTDSYGPTASSSGAIRDPAALNCVSFLKKWS